MAAEPSSYSVNLMGLADARDRIRPILIAIQSGAQASGLPIQFQIHIADSGNPIRSVPAVPKSIGRGQVRNLGSESTKGLEQLSDIPFV